MPVFIEWIRVFDTTVKELQQKQKLLELEILIKELQDKLKDKD